MGARPAKHAARLATLLFSLIGVVAAQEDALPKDAEASTFGTAVVIPSGLRGDIYYILDGSWKLPNFEKLKPVGSIYATSLNVPSQSFLVGFPGVTTRFEWFAIDYKGNFWIEHPGIYRFALRSDDGSRLYIDNKLLINNDGIHAPQTEYGKIDLAGGIHSIRVSYFQGPREMVALILAVARPGEPWRVFSTKEFKPPLHPKDWKFSKSTDAAPRDDDVSPDAAALAILGTTPLANDFEFRVAAARFGIESVLTIEVPAKVLAATPDLTHQVARVHLSLLARVMDEQGQEADRFSLDAPYQIPTSNLPEVQASFITYTHRIHLRPGRYTVQAAVIDHEGARSSARVIELIVPEPRPGIDLSTVALVERVEPAGTAPDPFDPLVYQGKRVVPLLNPVLGPSTKPAVYFVVYPDKAGTEKPQLRVEFVSNGQSLANQTAELPSPDASGAIPVLVAAAACPRNCELRVTASQGSASVTGSVAYSTGP